MNRFKRTYHNFSGIVVPAETECPECDCSSCTVTFFFYKDFNDILDINIDTQSYIANQADYILFTCPSCDERRKM